jgi:hypothetical protein
MKVRVGQGIPAGDRTLLARLTWPSIADLVQPKPSCSSREEDALGFPMCRIIAEHLAENWKTLSNG